MHSVSLRSFWVENLLIYCYNIITVAVFAERVSDCDGCLHMVIVKCIGMLTLMDGLHMVDYGSFSGYQPLLSTPSWLLCHCITCRKRCWLSSKCNPLVQPKGTLKKITFPKGGNGTYFPSIRLISRLYYAYKDWWWSRRLKNVCYVCIFAYLI